MIIPSFPFCTVILLFLSCNVLALPQPGESILLHTLSRNWFQCYTQKGPSTALVKHGEIGTHIASYQKISDDLTNGRLKHSHLGKEHHGKPDWRAIPQGSLEHHAEASKQHWHTVDELGKTRTQVDRKIQELKKAQDEGRDYHDAHNAANMHATAQHALTSALKSRETMNKMNGILSKKVPLWEKGHPTTEHDNAYITLSKQASDESKKALLG